MDDGGDAPSIAVITLLIHPKKMLRFKVKRKEMLKILW